MVAESKKILVRNWFLVLVGIFLTFLAWERLTLPSFWDETKVYFRPLFWMYENQGNFFSLGPTKFDRPPGLHLFYLPFLWLFGPDIFIVRLLNVIFFYCGVAFFYRVAEKQNTAVAMVTTTFLLITPIICVYFVQYIGDVQLFVLYSAILYLLTFHKDNYKSIFVLGFLSGLTREPAIFLAPAILLYYRYSNKDLNFKKYLVSFAPIFGISTILLINYFRTGLFFNHLTMDSGHIDFFLGMPERLHTLYRAFLVPYRILPLIALASIMFFVNRKTLRIHATDVFCLTIGLAHLALFSSHVLAIPRYFLACFPFVSYLLLRISFAETPSRNIKVVIAILALLPAILIGTPEVKDKNGFYFMTGYHDTMEYTKVLETHQKAIATVKSQLSNTDTILTSWPFISILESKYAGYGPPGYFTILPPTENINVPPKAILWTNFPEQIPRSEVDRLLTLAEYKELSFNYPPIEIRLYLKSN